MAAQRQGSVNVSYVVEGEPANHPQVAEAAIVGVPDADGHEIACAVVVPRKTPPSLATVQRLVADDIPLPQAATIRRGTRLLSDIGRHRRMGHPEPDTFRLDVSTRPAHSTSRKPKPTPRATLLETPHFAEHRSE
ncbi:hypothetical protein OG444_39745 [Streptomyces sp. NBC_01232]|uniref:AMP-binding enzyme n=1 Tax=Streptomyces sp. NBC_01232 TaxID=2903786 RepID=UPI002E0D9C31|nr:hypothetical protein OG444_00085 [Streptomyces sp. NBC_01232]WSQ03262.1 hypothetical protein OG444_39745 [Streptomyces sp. NBC_01232]